MTIKGSEKAPITLDMLLKAKDQRIAALEAELAPWREMARQVEELVRGRHVVEIDGSVLDNGEIGYSLWARQRNSWGHGVSGLTLPAAYEQVKGAGDA